MYPIYRYDFVEHWSRSLSRRSAIVIGAGIVGLSTAYRLSEDGIAVTLVDRDPAGDKASFGNAAGIAVTEVMPASVPGLAWKVPGWLFDPLGPLAVRPAHLLKLLPWLWRFARAGQASEVERIGQALAALNRRVYDDLLPMLEAIGCANEIHRKGALTVYETEAGFRRDADEWAFKRKHGIEVQMLTADEARALEPALGPIVARGVLTPQWSHINNPKLLVDHLRAWLETKRGVSVVAGEVSRLFVDNRRPSVALKDRKSLSADYVIVAAGAWSGALARTLGDRVLLESERGYNTTLPSSGVVLEREVIFAERKFVATPLSIGLRIGGAAEFGGLDAKANFKRSDALVKLASRYLPGLRSEGGVAWAGHRPATPDSLPVIGPSARDGNIFYAFGHGHLGLTQAATTGKLIADLVARRSPPIDLAPCSISRFN
jgi:D-amino-acid dehydrogenase